MFFTQFNQLMTGSVDVTMVIRKSTTGMTVSVLPKSNGLKDEAQNHIVPLTLSGTPEELDNGFFQTIARPVQKVSGLLANMAEFEKQADKAAKDSKAVKDMKAKETKEEKEKREKYEKLMKKADEMVAAKNHKEAVAVLGQAKAYANPQQVKEIEEKIKAQTAELNKGSLFGMEAFDQQPAPQPVSQQQPQQVPQSRPIQRPAPGNIPQQPHPAGKPGTATCQTADTAATACTANVSLSRATAIPRAAVSRTGRAISATGRIRAASGSTAIAAGSML